MTTAHPPRNRRGRPELSDAARTQMRKNIETKALELFQAEGYGAVSMRRLARELGCAPMTLYSYFDSKIDILRALWADVFVDLFDCLEARMAAEPDPRKKLIVLANGYVNYWLDHTEHYRMVFMAEGVSQPEVSAFMDDPEIASRFMAFFEAVSAIPDAPSSPAALKEACDFLLSALHGIAHCHITMSGYRWSSPEKLVARAIASLR